MIRIDKENKKNYIKSQYSISIKLRDDYKLLIKKIFDLEKKLVFLVDKLSTNLSTKFVKKNCRQICRQKKKVDKIVDKN